MEYGQLTVETLDSVAPRLQRFTEKLMDHLQASKIKMKITSTYLLNSTDHPINVPCSGNGIPIEMSFDATLPVWAPDPRARVTIRINHGKRHYYTELGKNSRAAKFPFAKILPRILVEIKTAEKKYNIQVEKEHKAIKAQINFKALSESLEMSPTEKDPDIIRKGNIKIMNLPQTPTQVIIMLTVSHEQAVEITKSYLKK